ncbi:MAG: hypothetical protein EPO21_22505 [Chloroflexota bacterium]|nr:MAG: hypothetical protein EPO21_22505 [Chloroflexota bacterium]
MKFLLDESTDYRIAAYLISTGHDVTAIAHEYPSALADYQVLELAHAELRVLITEDRDFGELVFRRRLPHAGVILLRLQTVEINAKIDRLSHLLARYSDQLQQFLVLTERGVRVRRTPPW